MFLVYDVGNTMSVGRWREIFLLYLSAPYLASWLRQVFVSWLVFHHPTPQLSITKRGYSTESHLVLFYPFNLSGRTPTDALDGDWRLWRGGGVGCWTLATSTQSIQKVYTLLQPRRWRTRGLEHRLKDLRVLPGNSGKDTKDSGGKNMKGWIPGIRARMDTRAKGQKE